LQGRHTGHVLIRLPGVILRLLEITRTLFDMNNQELLNSPINQDDLAFNPSTFTIRESVSYISRSLHSDTNLVNGRSCARCALYLQRLDEVGHTRHRERGRDHCACASLRTRYRPYSQMEPQILKLERWI